MALAPPNESFWGSIETPWGRQVFEFQKIDENAALLDGDQVVPTNRISPIEGDQAVVQSPLALFSPAFGNSWPFRIPYTTAGGFNKASELQFAMNEISRKTQITFVQRTTETDYLEFTNVAPAGWDASYGGMSYIGRVGGKQPVYLNPCATCANASTAAHEIGHALGFIHEHQRPDRDAYVTIGQATNMTSSTYSGAELLSPYDQLSIMHYDNPYVVAKNGAPFGSYRNFELTGQVLTAADARAWNTAYPHHCRITLPSCSVSTELYRKFIDADATSTTPQGCFARAMSWADYCQISSSSVVRADYFSFGTLMAWHLASRSGLVPSLGVAGPSNVSQSTAASVRFSGGCSAGAGPVTVAAGPLSVSAPCQLESQAAQGALWTYRFSVSLDLRVVPDAPALVIRASQRNGAGEGGSQTTVNKDTQAPASPVIMSPSEGMYLKAKKPMLRGTVEANATVLVTRQQSNDGGLGLCSTIATSAGDWSCTPSQDLVEGLNEIAVVGRDALANTGMAAIRRVVIDTVAPAAPEVRTPLAGSRNGPRVAFSGLGEAGARVTVREQANTMCSTEVAMDRTWSCMSSALSFGSHQVLVRQTDRAANDSVDSPPVTFDVDQIPEVQLAVLADIGARQVRSVAVSGTCSLAAVPVEVALERLTATSPCMGNAFQVVFDVTSLVDGELVVTARQVSASGTGEDRRTVRKDVKAPEGTTIEVPVGGSSLRAVEVISGTTEPNATVALRLPNGTMSVVADTSGCWQTASLPGFAEGPLSIVVMAQDALGNEGPEVSSSITIDSLPPEAPRFDPSTFIVDAAPFTVRGRAEPLARVSVRLAGQAACDVEATAAGTFSCSIDASVLKSGSHQVTAVATDAAQNQSEESTPFEFSIRAGAVIGGCSATGGVEVALLGAVAWWVASARRRRRQY